MVEKLSNIFEDDDFYDPEDDMDFTEYDSSNDEIAEEFAEELFAVLNDIIQDSSDLNEDFTSGGNMNKHYIKHCLGKNLNKTSTRQNVFYDFNDRSKYCAYEKEISHKINNSRNEVASLFDYSIIMRYIRKLFEGDFVINFCNSCGLRNSNGTINMSLISFSSDVTTNYSAANTIDICIKTAAHRTITLYPVDVNYLQNKFNNIIKRFSVYEIDEFEFNNDLKKKKGR